MPVRVLLLACAAAGALLLTACDGDDVPAAEREMAQVGTGEGCPGFDPKLSAEENAARASAFIDNEGMPAAAREQFMSEVAATLRALPEWAPVHPCGVQLSADSPPDGSGVVQLTYSLDGDAAAVADFYAKTFAGHGEVSSIVEDGGGPIVHTVNLVGPGGTIDVHIQAFPPDEDGVRAPLSVVLRGEGLPS